MTQDHNHNRPNEYQRRMPGDFGDPAAARTPHPRARTASQGTGRVDRPQQQAAPRHAGAPAGRAQQRDQRVPQGQRPHPDAQARDYSRARYASEPARRGAHGQRPQPGPARRGAHGRQPQPPRRKLPLVPILGIALAIVLLFAVGSFVLKGCSGSESDSGDTLAASDTSADATSTQAADGQIIMTLGGCEDTIVLQGEEYLESGCHAVDKEDGDITSSVQTSGDVDTSKPGDYTVTYTATNKSNAQATKTRTVHVVDSMDKDTDGITVFMYHYVYADDDPPKKNDTNYLPQSKLRKQLEWLTENDYYFPSYQELRAYVDGTHSLPEKSVVLTFDDGQSGFLDYGIPVLEEYKVPATSFIICDRDGSAEKIQKYASEYVTFQSHSYGLHNDGKTNIGRGGRIYDLSKSELVDDAKKAADMLGTNEAFAYPYGDVSDSAPSALEEAGLLCAFTINYDQVHQGDDPYRLSRIRVFGDGSLDGFIHQVKKGKD